MDAKRLDLIKQTEASLNKVAKMPAFEDDKGFKEQTTEALYQMLKVYSEDYKAVDMLAGTRTATIENMEQYFKLQETAEAKLQVVNDSVDAAQQRFAKRHKMTISEDPEGKRLANYMRQVSEVNTYQHKVYLAQFRVEKANARLTDALNSQNAEAFEQARLQLVEDTKAATAGLTSITPFRGKDAQYRDAARNLVKFYAAFAANQAAQMKVLLERKDSFTKADADKFNGFINLYNSQNQKLSTAYNQAGNNFQAAYIPVFND
ncbi:LIC11966 family surface protein [Hymenobacter sp.]|uniref:LIC11966 family surface protein n=1 Tax=Hymenobacter sp. TaxID=1898978 RepID=UPI0039C88710